jgi:hypothetical protein
VRLARTSTQSSETQLLYARILDWGARVGFILLFVTFVVYISGILNPYVPLEELPQYWRQSVHYYLRMARIKPGWAWLGQLHHGDFLNFLPIAILAGVTTVGYLSVVVRFFKRREIILGVIAILEVIILLLAASGILKVGGH